MLTMFRWYFWLKMASGIRSWSIDIKWPAIVYKNCCYNENITNIPIVVFWVVTPFSYVVEYQPTFQTTMLLASQTCPFMPSLILIHVTLSRNVTCWLELIQSDRRWEGKQWSCVLNCYNKEFHHKYFTEYKKKRNSCYFSLRVC
jgi:hypothetical protein